MQGDTNIAMAISRGLEQIVSEISEIDDVIVVLASNGLDKGFVIMSAKESEDKLYWIYFT